MKIDNENRMTDNKVRSGSAQIETGTLKSMIFGYPNITSRVG